MVKRSANTGNVRDATDTRRLADRGDPLADLIRERQDAELDKLVPKIRKTFGTAIAAMIATGTLLRHGWRLLGRRGRASRFGSWVDESLGLARSTCYELMALADHFADCAVADRIGVTALKLLAAPSVPQAVRDAVIAKAEANLRLPLSDVKALIAEAKGESAPSQAVRPLSVRVADFGTLVIHTNQTVDRDRLETLLRELAHELRKGTSHDNDTNPKR